MWKFFGILALALVLCIGTGCQSPTTRALPRPADSGEVLVYLQPLPPETGRLHFTMAEVAAIREDGSAIPLQLHLESPTQGNAGRQRLLAAGPLPAGAYLGLALTVARAFLTTEEGEAALLLPEGPVFVSTPFSLPRRGAALLEVAYRHEGSVRQQFQFVPAFFAHLPDQPVVSRLAFASSPGADLLTVFDRKTLRATGVVAAGERPAGLALDERQKRLYVSLAGEDAVAVFDAFSGGHIGRIRLQNGDRPERIALSPGGRQLLSANAGSDSVSFLDPQSLVEITRVAVGDEPHAVLIDRSGRLAYVFNLRSDSISVIDLARRQVVRTLAVDPGPFRGAFSRDGSRLYVIHRATPYLTVLDTAALTVRQRLPVGMGIGAVLVDSRTDLLYLGRTDAPRIDVYDPFSLLPVDYLQAPGAVAELVIDDEENRLLVTSSTFPTVAAVDLVGKGEAGRLDSALLLHSLTLMGERR